VHQGHVAVARYLLEVGHANVNAQSTNGNTPLHVAATTGHVDLAHLLLGAGARKNVGNRAGQLPADLARSEGLRQLLAPVRPTRRAAAIERRTERTANHRGQRAPSVCSTRLQPPPAPSKRTSFLFY